MICVCSHCGVVYNVKEPIEQIEISHGICPECLPGVLEGIERQVAEIERGTK